MSESKTNEIKTENERPVTREDLEALRAEYEVKLAEARGEVKANGEEDVEIDIYRDPYNLHDPWCILKPLPPSENFPEGRMLYWLNPKHRETRGFKGWRILHYGDPEVGKNGERLEGYVSDPPQRLQHQTGTEVRRGDSVLGVIDKRIFDQRQWERIKKCEKRRRVHTGSRPVVTETGIRIEGPGLEDERRPDTGWRIQPPAPGSKRIVPD